MGTAFFHHVQTVFHLSPLLMRTGEVVPLGAVKLITFSIHSHASTLMNDCL
jgi:hypothetical protein